MRSARLVREPTLSYRVGAALCHCHPKNKLFSPAEPYIARAILLKKSDFIGVSQLCSFAQAFVTQLLRSFLAADRDYIYLCDRK